MPFYGASLKKRIFEKRQFFGVLQLIEKKSMKKRVFSSRNFFDPNLGFKVSGSASWLQQLFDDEPLKAYAIQNWMANCWPRDENLVDDHQARGNDRQRPGGSICGEKSMPDNEEILGLDNGTVWRKRWVDQKGGKAGQTQVQYKFTKIFYSNFAHTLYSRRCKNWATEVCLGRLLVTHLTYGPMY